MGQLTAAWDALGTGTRVTLAWLAAVLVPLGLAAALIPIRGNSPSPKVALILALAVAVLAMPGNRATAIAAAVSAGLGFDLFHTRPYYTPAINRLQDVETTALLLAVGVVVGQLAARTGSTGRVRRRQVMTSAGSTASPRWWPQACPPLTSSTRWPKSSGTCCSYATAGSIRIWRGKPGRSSNATAR